jgi:outer membrane scaffolding protein for murein synthesis (MipA/OmpV family)
LTVSLCLVSGAAVADDAKSDREHGLHGHVFLGGAAVPDYEGSADYMPAPIAAGKLGYNEFYVEAKGPQLRANVMPKVLPFGFDFGPTLGYRFGRGDVENDRVDALRNIDGAVTVGGFAKIYSGDLLQRGDELTFEIESATGLDRDNDGTTIQFGPRYSFSPLDKLRLGFDLSATWASDRYTETYFGVGASNALRSGFSTYDAEGGIKDIGLSVNATYMWSENWGVTGMVGVTQLIGDAADSPIVEAAGSATQGIATLGVVYSF